MNPPEYSSDPNVGRVRLAMPNTPMLSEAGAHPPSYTTTIRMGWPMRLNSTHLTHVLIHDSFVRLSAPFYHPPPPPSYSESEFCSIRLPPVEYTMVWGAAPQIATCPCCGLIAMTVTKTQCTRHTHYTCLALCLCACWPCCLLPYCLKTCKITEHKCARCEQPLGIYNPWKIIRTCQTI